MPTPLTTTIRLRAEDLGVLEAIGALDRIEGCMLRSLGHRLIVDRYFDTGDWRLFGQGCWYRERMIERRRWVAFRGSPEMIAHRPDPAEFELPICTRLDETAELLPPILRAWVAAGRKHLAEILRTENNRTLVEIVEDGEPRFLMCLDDLEFFSNGSQRRCCEVKLSVRRDPNEQWGWITARLRREFDLKEVTLNRLQLGLALTDAEPRDGTDVRSLHETNAGRRSIFAS